MEKLFYLINVSVSEWNSNYRYITTSLEDAESHIMEYADWYCDKGTCSIEVVNEHFNTIETRFYTNGKLRKINSYKLRRKK